MAPSKKTARWNQPSRTWLASLALAFLLVVAAGCGDGGEDQPTPGSTAPTSTTETAPQAEGNRSQGGGEESEPSGGGEKSIEEFGSEAEGSEEDAIVGSFTAYLEALADDDLATACSYLASNVQQSLTQLAGDKVKRSSCPAILSKLLAPTAPAVAREQVEGEITKVRVQGDRAFVVFHAPGAKLFQMTMVREGGDWKVAIVAASVLVPDL